MARRGRLAASSVVLLLLAAQRPAIGAQAPLGYWFPPNHEGVVQVAPCQGDVADLCGVIVGVTSTNGKVPIDVNGTPQCHLILLNRLAPGDDGRWHGTVRNPEDGRVYSAEAWTGPDGAMRLRGFIGLELFGATQTWMAFTGKVEPDCRFKP